MIKKTFLLGLSSLLFSLNGFAATEVRLAVHKSFSLPQEVLAKFEQENNAKVSIIKVGSGNEMLNKLILSRANPIADAVYGLDNANIGKASQSGILAIHQPRSKTTVAGLPGIAAVNYAYVAINYDKKWFDQKGLALPKTLEDLTKPEYKDLLVMPNPGTSSPGLAFLMANIGYMGEQKAFSWWGNMRKNGVKITKSWSDAYYTEFTQNGGSRPLIVSYTTSPAAEVFFSKGRYRVPPTGNLLLKGGVYRQVEGAAVLRGAAQPALAGELVAFLQDPEAQQALPAEMWVYPAIKDTRLPPAFGFVEPPPEHSTPGYSTITRKQQQWVNRWIRTVLR
ncbi:thiamine ABC transporter substrate-binding protein [Neisseria sp. S1]|uniref:thiamine ABC transporter substrate-binding protein n=1 Tax=Neisseria sp. S1 TaxID=3318354 RepID=UPI003A868641